MSRNNNKKKKKEQKGKQTINNWISIQTYKKQKHGQILNITHGHTHGHIHNKNTHIQTRSHKHTCIAWMKIITLIIMIYIYILNIYTIYIKYNRN